MQDMLVKLYDLPRADACIARAAEQDVVIRVALNAEAAIVTGWVRERFGPGWASEATAALSRTPATCLLALRERGMLGFACWDVSALGFFGPTGVDASARGGGIGAALLHAALRRMRAQGYGYAIIGANALPGFYAKVAGAVPIEGSSPGIYAGLLV